MKGMNDNRKVNDNHQGGIERVKQRSGDLEKGCGGKMGTYKPQADFRRSGGKLTPRKG